MKNIIIFIFTTLIMSFCVDYFLKFTRISAATLKYYNEEYGSLNRSNISYFKSVEGLYVGNTNYDGRFREDYSPQKADKKTLRILLMGDSFVEGIDVFSVNHFAQYIETILGKKLNRKVEVLNCGRGNATIHTMSYYFYNYLSKKYDIDLVLLFTEGRDIYDSGDGNSYPSTFYKLDSLNNLVKGENWKSTPEYNLHKKLLSLPILKYYENSGYFRLLYRAIARTRIQGFKQITFGKFFDSPKELDYHNSTSHDALSRITKKLYDTLATFNKGQVVFVLRNKPTYTPAIEEYISAKNYKYFNLADTFDDFNIKNTKIDAYYFKATNTYGGHWNNDGHKTVGTFLANKIYNNFNEFVMPGYEK